MEILTLEKRPGELTNKKIQLRYEQLESVLQTLREKELAAEIIEAVNAIITQVNASLAVEKTWGQQLNIARINILRMLEKKLKIVPKNYYRNLWMSMGMAAFGLPIGVAFGTSMGNMAYLGIGLPIGMAVGIVVGMQMDKKAEAEGRQLEMEMNF